MGEVIILQHVSKCTTREGRGEVPQHHHVPITVCIYIPHITVFIVKMQLRTKCSVFQQENQIFAHLIFEFLHRLVCLPDNMVGLLTRRSEATNHPHGTLPLILCTCYEAALFHPQIRHIAMLLSGSTQ